MEALVTIHGRLSTTIFLYVLLMALWGFWRFFRKQGIASNYWGALVIAEIIILVQGLLGIILWATAHTPARGGIHILYGVVSLLTLPAVYLFTKGHEERRDLLVYSAALLFLVGISMRSISTGG